MTLLLPVNPSSQYSDVSASIPCQVVCSPAASDLQLVTCIPPASSLHCRESCRMDILPPPPCMASVVWSAAPLQPPSAASPALGSIDAFLPETKATVRASNKSIPLSTLMEERGGTSQTRHTELHWKQKWERKECLVKGQRCKFKRLFVKKILVLSNFTKVSLQIGIISPFVLDLSENRNINMAISGQKQGH